LFAASRIKSGGLKMPVLRRANPNTAISRRNCEPGEAFAFGKAENSLSIIIKIRKAFPSLTAANSRGVITAMAQSERHYLCIHRGEERDITHATGHFNGCFWLCAWQGRAASDYGRGDHGTIVALKSKACGIYLEFQIPALEFQPTAKVNWMEKCLFPEAEQVG
jgi:hypothetical protein